MNAEKRLFPTLHRDDIEYKMSNHATTECKKSLVWISDLPSVRCPSKNLCLCKCIISCALLLKGLISHLTETPKQSAVG